MILKNGSFGLLGHMHTFRQYQKQDGFYGLIEPLLGTLQFCMPGLCFKFSSNTAYKCMMHLQILYKIFFAFGISVMLLGNSSSWGSQFIY